MSASKTSLGPLPLIDGITITIAAERDGWITRFARNDETIAADHSKTLPWIGRYAPGHLATLICDAVPLDKKAVKAEIARIFKDIETSPDAAAMVSEPADRVINETVSVKIELSDPPIYVVELKGGKSMVFTAKEIAAPAAVTLNTKWLSLYPRTPLYGNSQTFGTVIDYWLRIAEEVEPVGNANPWEGIVERLQIRIAPYPVYPTKEGLTKSGLYLEENGPLWIAGRVIAEVIRESGASENDSGFSKYLQAAGILVCPSKPIRVGGILIRAWGFSPDIRPDDPGVSDCASLTAEEEV